MFRFRGLYFTIEFESVRVGLLFKLLTEETFGVFDKRNRSVFEAAAVSISPLGRINLRVVFCVVAAAGGMVGFRCFVCLSSFFLEVVELFELLVFIVGYPYW